MKTRKSSRPKATQSKIQWFLHSPYAEALVFAVAVIGLIVALLSHDPRVLWPAILIATFFVIWALYLVRGWLAETFVFLSLKFFAGIILGMIVAAIIGRPLLDPLVYWTATLTKPHVDFLKSLPGNDEYILDEAGSVLIRFSEPIPWPYYLMFTVELTPNTPHNVIWSLDHEWLAIGPTKLFSSSENRDPYVGNPRFEYNTKYYVRVSGPTLAKPIEFDFYTRPK